MPEVISVETQEGRTADCVKCHSRAETKRCYGPGGTQGEQLFRGGPFSPMGMRFTAMYACIL
jgi:hypothetical protein